MRHQVCSVLRLECFSIVRIVVSGVLSDKGHPVTGASLINHPAVCLLCLSPALEQLYYYCYNSYTSCSSINKATTARALKTFISSLSLKIEVKQKIPG